MSFVRHRPWTDDRSSVLIANKVFLGLVTAWRFCDCPTNTSSSLVKSDNRRCSTRTFAVLNHFCYAVFQYATHEFVVPKSMPIILAIEFSRLEYILKSKFCYRYGGCFKVCSSLFINTRISVAGFRELLPPKPWRGVANVHSTYNLFWNTLTTVFGSAPSTACMGHCLMQFSIKRLTNWINHFNLEFREYRFKLFNR